MHRDALTTESLSILLEGWQSSRPAQHSTTRFARPSNRKHGPTPTQKITPNNTCTTNPKIVNMSSALMTSTFTECCVACSALQKWGPVTMERFSHPLMTPHTLPTAAKISETKSLRHTMMPLLPNCQSSQWPLSCYHWPTGIFWPLLLPPPP